MVVEPAARRPGSSAPSTRSAASSRARSWSAANGSRRRRGLTIARPIGGRVGVALLGGARLGGGLGVQLGLALGGQRLAQALAGPGQQRAGGDVGHAERGGELEPGEVVELGEEQRGPLALGDPLERPLELARQAGLHHQVLGGRRRVARLADERDEADDPAAAEVVERDAVGDLVQPRAGVLGLLERVVRAVRLDERVLRQVRGEIRVAQHAQQVRVDLVLVLREQLLDEAVRLVAVPAGAHGEPHGQGASLFELEGIGDHGCSGWSIGWARRSGAWRSDRL